MTDGRPSREGDGLITVLKGLFTRAPLDTSPPDSGSLLDPGWCESFMGFPAGWTDPGDALDGRPPAYVKPGSAVSETPSSLLAPSALDD